MGKSNQKKGVSSNNKTATINSSKSNGSSGRIVIVDYLIILLHLGVAFIPHLMAFDVIYTHWYYISALNLVSFAYIIFNKKQYSFEFNNTLAKYVFFGVLAFTLVCCLSMFNAINLSESITFFSMFLTTVITFFIMYLIVKDNPKKYFLFISYVLLGSLVIESFGVISHFAVKHGNKPRSSELFIGLNPTYGNQNILAASLAIKMSVVFYVYFKSKLIGKLISLTGLYVALFAILLVGARTAVFELPIILITVLAGVLIIYRENLLKTIKGFVVPVLIISTVAYVSAVSVNKIHKNKLNTFSDLIYTKGRASLYKKPVKNVGAKKAKKPDDAPKASDSGRGFFWEAAIDGFKSSPIIGVGIGNWKMLEKRNLVKSLKTNSYFYPRRVHNDYLQILSETGILGFLLFVGFFGVIYFLLIRSVFDRNLDADTKVLSIAIMGCFMAFSADSLINFPAERTPIQMFVFTILAVAIALFGKEKRIPIFKVTKFLVLLILVCVVYVNNVLYNSSKYQLIMRANINGKNVFKSKFKIRYDQMKKHLTDFPSLNGMGQPNDYGLAVLAYSEKKYDKAMEHLDRAIEVAPFQQEHYGFKSLIFELNPKYKNPDSVVYYSEKVFRGRPTVLNQFNLLRKYYMVNKDTVKLGQLYNTYLKEYPRNEGVWLNKVDYYYKYHKDIKRTKEVIDSALLYFPNSTKLTNVKKAFSKIGKNVVVPTTNNNQLKYTKARQYFAKAKYGLARKELSELVRDNPNNNIYKLTLGQCEFFLKNYPASVKVLTEVVNSNTFKDGKPEYNRGLAYTRLGNRKAAAIDFRASKAKGFHLAKRLDKSLLEVK